MWKPSSLQINCLKEFYEHHCSNPMRVGSKAQARWGKKYNAQKDYLITALKIPTQVVEDFIQQGNAYCDIKERGDLTNEYKERFKWDYWWPIYFDSCKNNYEENGMTPEEYKSFIEMVPPEEEPDLPEETINNFEYEDFPYQLNDNGEKIPLFPTLTDIGVKNFKGYYPPPEIDAGEGMTVDLNRLKAYLEQLKPGDMFRFSSVIDGNKSYAKYVGTDENNGERCYLCQNKDYYATYYEDQLFTDFYGKEDQAFIIRECNVIDFDKSMYYDKLIGLDTGKLTEYTKSIKFATPSIPINEKVIKASGLRED